MKKSLFLTFFFPPERGGIQNYLYNIVLRLPGERVVVWVNEMQNHKSQITNHKFDGMQTFKIIRKNFASPLRFLGLTAVHNLFRIRKIIKDNNIEIIHCGHIHPHGLTAYFCKLLFRIPYIIYTHGTEILEIENDLKIKKYFIKKVLNSAQNIIVTTNFMEDYIDSRFKTNDKSLKNKIVKIPPGVDCERFKPLNTQNLRARFGIADNKIILTCGRLVPRKGHDMVLKALPNIIKIIPNIKYWIVGSGPCEQKLRLEIKNLRLNNYVKIFNNIQNKDLNFYYNLTDVFIMPSRQEKKDIEGFGIVYLEANAVGKPVIGGNSGGVAEAVVDGVTGLLVNPESIKEITGALLKLLQNNELAKEFGNNGRQRVLGEFDWNKLVNRIVRLLR